jgi:hypothetical protein
MSSWTKWRNSLRDSSPSAQNDNRQKPVFLEKTGFYNHKTYLTMHYYIVKYVLRLLRLFLRYAQDSSQWQRKDVIASKAKQSHKLRTTNRQDLFHSVLRRFHQFQQILFWYSLLLGCFGFVTQNSQSLASLLEDAIPKRHYDSSL